MLIESRTRKSSGIQTGTLFEYTFNDNKKMFSVRFYAFVPFILSSFFAESILNNLIRTSLTNPAIPSGHCFSVELIFKFSIIKHLAFYIQSKAMDFVGCFSAALLSRPCE